MHKYQYKPLSNPHREIRLIKLLPGIFNAQIQIVIEHVSLIAQPPGPESRERLSLLEIRGTLPEGCTAYETRDGEIVFFNTRTGKTSWTHPNPWTNPRLYSRTEKGELSKVDYTALSYAWGPEDDPEEDIYVVPSNKVHGSLHTSPVHFQKVRRNLFTALKHLRGPSEPRTFWIDSICINQQDPHEKGIQLRRMPEIYQYAPRSVIWLGDSTRDSFAALQVLEHLGKQLLVTEEDVPMPSPDATEASWYLPNTPLPFDDTKWNLIQFFCKNAYFERLWIWQEVVLSNTRATVQWGPHSAPWTTIRRAILRLFHRAANMPRYIRAQYQHVWSLAALRRNCYFQDILELTVRQLCTEPRDKIYGLLGLIDNRLRHRILPDYMIPTSEAYRLAFIAFSLFSKSLDLLAHCNLGTRLEDGPSWVPNWSKAAATKFYSGKDLYCPAQRRSAKWKIIGPDTLSVTGVHCGTISDVSPLVIPPHYSSDAIIKLWASVPTDLYLTTYINGEPKEAAYAATLCAGAVDYGVDAWKHGMPTLEQVREGFRRHILGSEPPDSKFRAEKDVYVNHIFETCRGRSLFTTHEGHVGLAPPGAQTGDLVCVILGCDVPILLRPRYAAVGWYKIVVGPAYVHGLMFGEALLGNFPRPWHGCVQHDFVSGLKVPTYRNWETGEVTLVDPRWPPLPQGWRMMTERQETDSDPAPHFERTDTGEIYTVHPCLLEDGLKERGVVLSEFKLV